MQAEVVVIGSGISGSFVAHELLAKGVNVVMLDVGNDDAESRANIPDLPFSEIVQNEDLAKSIFLGRNQEILGQNQARVGSQLTPTRQFITRSVPDLLPTTSSGKNIQDQFTPMQSLALGGLGAGWGAGAFTFSESELKQCGIWEPHFDRLYNQAAQIAGISGSHDSDVGDMCEVASEFLQPALEMDQNHESFYRHYLANPKLRQGPCHLGPIPLAMLSRDKMAHQRRANPYHDMDFYSDVRRSIFRPRYLIEEMRRNPRFTYRGQQLALKVRDLGTGGGDGAEVITRDLGSGEISHLRTRRVVICAGALNTGRLVLNSLARHQSPVPVLANPYHYVACVNLRQLGRPVRDRRHSMAQLLGVYRPPEDPGDTCVFPFFSYRSLLMFKLAKEFPLPPQMGALFARTLLSSLSIVGLWHSCRPGKTRVAQLFGGTENSSSDQALPTLHFDFKMEPEWKAKIDQRNKAMRSFLWKLGVVPLKMVDTGPGGGIHYAGTLPSSSSLFTEFTTAQGQVRSMPHVYCGDSSPWGFLPSKGLSFTLMANGLRVAQHVARSL